MDEEDYLNVDDEDVGEDDGEDLTERAGESKQVRGDHLYDRVREMLEHNEAFRSYKALRRSLNGGALSVREKLTIGLANEFFRAEDEARARKNKTRMRKVRGHLLPSTKTSLCLGYDQRTVNEVLKNAEQGALDMSEAPPMNRSHRTRRIPEFVNGRETNSVIRDFVASKRAHLELVTAVDVTRHMLEQRLIETSGTETDFRNVLRLVQKFLVEKGWTRGVVKGGHTLMERN